MPITNPARRLGQRSRLQARGPAVTFAASVLTVFAAIAACTAMLAAEFVLPAVSTLLFVMAALVALAAWRWESQGTSDQISYWDVAGALTLLRLASSWAVLVAVKLLLERRRFWVSVTPAGTVRSPPIVWTPAGSVVSDQSVP